MSVLVISEILEVFVNALTADDSILFVTEEFTATNSTVII